jgi:succinate dehydrogenase / fumarate reductase cytochrome b subunit
MSVLKDCHDFVFGSSIGKKIIVAVTGILLILFLIGHMIGNLQMFLPPEWINAYAHKLQTFPLLWPIRFILLGIIGLHIYTTILLVIENRKARPDAYDDKRSSRSTFASRTMAVSGLLVIAFVVFHIMHFTTKSIFPYANKTTIEKVDHPVQDVHLMMVEGFSKPLVSTIYILAVGLISLHVSHGTRSVFQTLGINSPRVKPIIQGGSYVLAVGLFLGFASLPFAVMAGIIEKETGSTAAQEAPIAPGTEPVGNNYPAPDA